MGTISKRQSPSPTGSRTIHRQLAMFELLRRLGFTPDDIYVSWDDVNKVPFTLLKQGEKEFLITYNDAVDHPETMELYRQEWEAESERWNAGMTPDERTKIYKINVTAKTVDGLVTALREKGFYIPKVDN